MISFGRIAGGGGRLLLGRWLVMGQGRSVAAAV